ncbi:hypothetical protein BGZ76_008538 [Entomortierella beljakovae]|nr:hypothetical protein BGZ76_008538 [Entomortierella beljakovae]
MSRLYQNHYFKFLKIGIVLAAVICSGSLSVVNAYAGSHPTNMDVRMREFLCINQMRMCQVSCQLSIQDNTCNTDTLEWSCVCSSSTKRIFGDWQFPIPFKLCTRDLLSCIKACPESNDMDPSHQKQQVRMSLTNDDNGFDGYDEDDYDALDEIQQLRRNSALIGNSYSRFGAEGQKRMTLSKKKKQLHRQLWVEQRNEIISETFPGDANSDDKITAFTTFLDTNVYHKPSCVSSCQSVYSCGTEAAPEFHGVQQILQ